MSALPGLRPVAAMLAVATAALFGIGLAADAAHAEPSVVGDAGSFDGCAGFRGNPVATATLTGLADDPLDTAWPAGATAQTFRITVTSGSDAAAGTARATFVWS